MDVVQQHQETGNFKKNKVEEQSPGLKDSAYRQLDYH